MFRQPAPPSTVTGGAVFVTLPCPTGQFSGEWTDAHHYLPLGSFRGATFAGQPVTVRITRDLTTLALLEDWTFHVNHHL